MVNLIGYWKMPRPQCNKRYEEGCIWSDCTRISINESIQCSGTKRIRLANN